MDIFTTQLTKVAPNQIRPEKLRVKAIAKDARIHKLKDDVKELESEETWGKNTQENNEPNQQSEAHDEVDERSDEDDDDNHHLDLYV